MARKELFLPLCVLLFATQGGSLGGIEALRGPGWAMAERGRPRGSREALWTDSLAQQLCWGEDCRSVRVLGSLVHLAPTTLPAGSSLCQKDNLPASRPCISSPLPTAGRAPYFSATATLLGLQV